MHVVLLFVVLIVRIMVIVWLLRSVVVSGGRWVMTVLLIVDVQDMEYVMLMVAVFVILVLCLIRRVRNVSMNV
jgi:hypothetical protein